MNLIGLFSDDWKTQFSKHEIANGDLQEKAGRLEGKIWQNGFPPVPNTEVAVFLESMLSGGEFFPAEYRRYSRLGAERPESLQFAFELAFEKGYRHFLFVETIIPNCSTELVPLALEEMQMHDVVLAPAEDGSVAVLGMNPKAFRNWNLYDLQKPEMVVELLSECHSLGLKSKLLPMVYARSAWNDFQRELTG